MTRTTITKRLRLLDMLRTNFELIRRTDNPSLSLQAEVTKSASNLRHLLGDPPDPEALNALGWFHWYRYLASTDDTSSNDQELAIEAFLRSSVLAGDLIIPDEAKSLMVERASPNLAILHKWLLSSADVPDTLAADVVSGWRILLSITPAGHQDRVDYLSNLAVALECCFERTGSMVDLDEAINLGRRVLEEMPPDDANRAVSLNNLGVALLERFDRLGADEDLTEAVAIGRTATQYLTEHASHRCAVFTNFANILTARSERLPDVSDIEEAIKFGELAVEAGESDDPSLVVAMSSLANSLWTRHRAFGEENDLSRAIAINDEMLRLVPADHAIRANALYNLGSAFRQRWENTGDSAYLDSAVAAFTDCLGTLSVDPAIRIYAALAGSELIHEKDPGGAARLLEGALHLLPDVAPRHLNRAEQQRSVSRFRGLGGNAAAFALSDDSFASRPGERAMRALRLLELGRAVLLDQSLDTRIDVRQLRARDPDLLHDFLRLRRELDVVSSATSTTLDRHRLTTEYEATLKSIRSLTDFSSFMKTSGVDELLTESSRGPIAVFNITRHRCDTILLTVDGVRSLQLDGLTQQDLLDKIVEFRQAVRNCTGVTPDDLRLESEDVISRILEWLWDAVAEPVISALGLHDEPGHDSVWPRMWWIPGGLLGLLPIHAAGYHRSPQLERGRTVMDCVVSSYAPSIRALHYARQNELAPDPAATALIVTMPRTPGESDLTFAAKEAAMVRTYFPDAITLGAGSDANAEPLAATKAHVLKSLEECAFLHFAGHCVSDAADPSLSRLLLEDHETDPLTFATLREQGSERAYLAFLSACQTALANINELIDEAIHPATAFQLAGFPHVIGTLWEIDDQWAFLFAKFFYALLLEHGQALLQGAPAYVVHEVVRGLRDKFPEFPSAWATHIHTGA
jgi:tetratricopeptide (TPR) repeat protein